jgi:quercetin dioxygenase-like cupin family protein
MFLLLAGTVTLAQPIENRGCAPVAERNTDIGCWILSRDDLGELSDSRVFWYIDSYSSTAAAEAAKHAHSTVVSALGKVWLFTIGTDVSEPSRGGVRVATVGPLLVGTGEKYVAQYMEGITSPGTTTPVHRHPGPEAWYTFAGEACLETPAGKATARAGQHIMAAEGEPMRLAAIGKEQSRWLVLVLYRASQPWDIPASDWVPKGLCMK